MLDVTLWMSTCLQVMSSEMMQESVDSKVGATGRILKAEYKRLSLEEEQDC